MKKLHLFMFFALIFFLSISFILAESMFSDRTNVKIENCSGCSYDGECVAVGTYIMPNHVCDENAQWESKTISRLSNGRFAVYKVIPETASQRAKERLGDLGFNITEKEIGKGNETKAVYHLEAEKDVKLFGFIKKKAKVEIDVDAENNGEVISIKKPWWSFMAVGF